MQNTQGQIQKSESFIFTQAMTQLNPLSHSLSCFMPACLSVPKVMEVDLIVSSSVLKQGEPLVVNCTVKDTEMVYFSWNFPRRQVPVSLSVSLSV